MQFRNSSWANKIYLPCNLRLKRELGQAGEAKARAMGCVRPLCLKSVESLKQNESISLFANLIELDGLKAEGSGGHCLSMDCQGAESQAAESLPSASSLEPRMPDSHVGVADSGCDPKGLVIPACGTEWRPCWVCGISNELNPRWGQRNDVDRTRELQKGRESSSEGKALGASGQIIQNFRVTEYVSFQAFWNTSFHHLWNYLDFFFLIAYWKASSSSSPSIYIWFASGAQWKSTLSAMRKVPVSTLAPPGLKVRK